MQLLEKLANQILFCEYLAVLGQYQTLGLYMSLHMKALCSKMNT